VTVEIFNTTRKKYLPKKKLAKLVESVLVTEGREFAVNLVFIGPQRMQALNRTYRGQDKSTDVLSFAADDPDEPPSFRPVGEIYICLQTAQKQAHKYNHSLTHEFLFLAAHGALHLCGYTHDSDQDYDFMMTKTREYIRRLEA
jgi:probable rRNA maturation factor